MRKPTPDYVIDRSQKQPGDLRLRAAFWLLAASVFVGASFLGAL